MIRFPHQIRTVRRWITAWHQAEATCGCGYAGLLPGWGRRGNRQRKLPAETLVLMDRQIREEYETIKGKVAERVYGAVVGECERLGLVVPSSATFHKAIRARPKHEQASKRQGRRAAYQYEVPYLELSLTHAPAWRATLRGLPHRPHPARHRDGVLAHPASTWAVPG